MNKPVDYKNLVVLAGVGSIYLALTAGIVICASKACYVISTQLDYIHQQQKLHENANKQNSCNVSEFTINDLVNTIDSIDKKKTQPRQ